MGSVEELSPIVAEPHVLEEGVVYGRLPGTTIKTLGGTMLLSELIEGSVPPQYEPRATASFCSGQPRDHFSPLRSTDKESPPDPVMFVGNGGPSSPGVLHNGQVFSGYYYIQHDDDGYLPDEPRVVSCYTSPYTSFKAVVHTDPVGTGVGEMLPGQDPAWAHSVERDAQIATALKLGYLQLAGLEQHPLMSTVSSYGVFREIGSALQMARYDKPIDSLTVISGAYDVRAIKYTSDDVLPFVALLPSLAVTSYYHKQRMIPNALYKVDHSPPYELFREAAMFAQSEYAAALRSGDVENRLVLERLQEYTGLPRELIVSHNLRISPTLFQTHRLPGRVLSAVDGRLHFPNDREIVIDPALDRWESTYMRFVTHNLSSFGHPRLFSTRKYRGIIVPGDEWRYDGRWKDGSVRDAMEELLTTLPTTTILDVSGIYDLLRPALWSEWFWNDMQQRTGVSCIQSFGTDINTKSYKSQVDMRLLAMGHQLTRPIPDKARQVVWNGILQQVVTSKYKQRV